MACRLIDQMDEDPAEVRTFTPSARFCKRRHRSDCRIRRRRPLSICDNCGTQRELRTWAELLIAPTDLLTAHPTLDPPPLHVSEVVDDADERDQGIVGPPPSVLVAQSFDFPQDCATKVAEPAEEQLPLIGSPARKIYFLVERHRSKIAAIRRCIHGTVCAVVAGQNTCVRRCGAHTPPAKCPVRARPSRCSHFAAGLLIGYARVPTNEQGRTAQWTASQHPA